MKMNLRRALAGFTSGAIAVSALVVPSAVAQEATTTEMNLPLACYVEPKGGANGLKRSVNAGDSGMDALSLSMSATAPGTVEVGEEFDYVIDPKDLTFPKEVRTMGQTIDVSFMSQANLWIDLPKNVEVLGVEYDKNTPLGFNVIRDGERIRFVGENRRDKPHTVGPIGHTGKPVGDNPAEWQQRKNFFNRTNEERWFYGGAEINRTVGDGSKLGTPLPKVTLRLKATGEAGSTIQPSIRKTDATSNNPQAFAQGLVRGVVSGQVINALTRCGLSQDYGARGANKVPATPFPAVTIVEKKPEPTPTPTTEEQPAPISPTTEESSAPAISEEEKTAPTTTTSDDNDQESTVKPAEPTEKQDEKPTTTTSEKKDPESSKPAEPTDKQEDESSKAAEPTEKQDEKPTTTTTEKKDPESSKPAEPTDKQDEKPTTTTSEKKDPESSKPAEPTEKKDEKPATTTSEKKDEEPSKPAEPTEKKDEKPTKSTSEKKDGESNKATEPTDKQDQKPTTTTSEKKDEESSKPAEPTEKKGDESSKPAEPTEKKNEKPTTTTTPEDPQSPTTTTTEEAPKGPANPSDGSGNGSTGGSGKGSSEGSAKGFFDGSSGSSELSSSPMGKIVLITLGVLAGLAGLVGIYNCFERNGYIQNCLERIGGIKLPKF